MIKKNVQSLLCQKVAIMFTGSSVVFTGNKYSQKYYAVLLLWYEFRTMVLICNQIKCELHRVFQVCTSKFFVLQVTVRHHVYAS